MSHRAIQRLRKERELQGLNNLSDDEDFVGDNEDEDDDDDSVGPVITGNNKLSSAFASAMINDDGDSSSDEEDDSDNDDDNGKEDEKESDQKVLTAKVKASSATSATTTSSDDAIENLDALLEEYKLQDEDAINPLVGQDDTSYSCYSIITSGMETRDLDIDYVMRTSLMGSNETSTVSSTNNRSYKRGNRQTTIFGPPRDNWPRPPHYVGGGMGMTSYDKDTTQQHMVLPWPYCDMKEGDERCPPIDKWYKFILSDSYQRDQQDFEVIKASGDANALAMFIAHHPFNVEGLLQLSIVLYQTNHSQEGLSLLKRALWVFEGASLNSFLKVENRNALMDYDLKENKLFFSALFRLIRVSYVAGLTRTALAASKFLLSLDPLRDPKNTLMALDHFALLCNTTACSKWLVEFVESKKVYVVHRDQDHPDGFECQLLDLPNWAFSYALALFRLLESNESDDEMKIKANNAIQNALCRFPTVIGQLLTRNEVDTTSRSLQTDWPSALDFVDDLTTSFQTKLSDSTSSDPVIRACIIQAYENCVRIFVQQNFKLWSSWAVLQWMFKNLQTLNDNNGKEGQRETTPISPAIVRYLRCDPTDYEDKFQTMPAEANPLDPNVIAHALHVDTNRPRLMQRMPRGRQFNGDGIDGAEAAILASNGGNFAGPPTEMIDPDLPLVEVFWRSALPWAHVEGVPPPNR